MIRRCRHCRKRKKYPFEENQYAEHLFQLIVSDTYLPTHPPCRLYYQEKEQGDAGHTVANNAVYRGVKLVRYADDSAPQAHKGKSF